MQIVFVDWKIRIGEEESFKQDWKTGLPVNYRTQMVGEFLNVVPKNAKYEWITWDLAESGDYTRFINVGLWANAEAFQEQIGRYFNPESGKKPYEFELRRRALLSPECWRMGDWKLPLHDSGGVL